MTFSLCWSRNLDINRNTLYDQLSMVTFRDILFNTHHYRPLYAASRSSSQESRLQQPVFFKGRYCDLLERSHIAHVNYRKPVSIKISCIVAGSRHNCISQEIRNGNFWKIEKVSARRWRVERCGNTNDRRMTRLHGILGDDCVQLWQAEMTCLGNATEK